MRVLAAACAVVLLLGSCSDSGTEEAGRARTTATTSTTAAPPETTETTAAPTTTTTALAAPTRPSPPRSATQEIRLTQVAELSQPLAMAVRTGDPALYVAEKGGRIRRLGPGGVDSTPVLDLSGQVSTGGEQGLLGLAWSPDGRFLYVNYTDRLGDTHVVEYPAGADGRLGGPRELFSVDQPFANHNGGNLVFGPDGMLYVGLGDGGSGGDPMNNAQSLGTLLGKMLRIDPRPSGGRPYGIPPDNPFVGRAGARPEIWQLGLRNPWRYSFDRSTRELWIGDVGQSSYEEVNLTSAASRGGENWGWPFREGANAFRGRQAPAGVLDPVHEYAPANGNCAVTGGYVYRGQRVAGALAGQYVFADACGGDLMALTRAGGRTSVRRLGLDGGFVSSFGEDAAGELYVLSLRGPVFRIDPA
jgi:glucose/arabinose dehydrogenase